MITGTDPPPVFATPADLRALFGERLLRLVDTDVLGVFILVLANASFDAALFERLRAPLAATFARWADRFDRHDPRAVDAAVDDVAVFSGLRDFGFDRLGATKRRCAGPWELQFNRMRAFRPPRISGTAVSGLHRPFDRAAFHFNKPFLRDEILWEGELAGTPVRLLYNKFPFAETHGLLVPYAAAERPQFLEPADHDLIWSIARGLGRQLPGIGFGYNAYGAHASVNHLHFQMFMRDDDGYPVESAAWTHNGGDRPYPLAVLRCDDVDRAWHALEALHRAGRSYNLVYRPGSMYLLPRAMQGHYVHSGWTGGFAWAELAGAVTTYSEADFNRLGAGDIEAELRRLAITP